MMTLASIVVSGPSQRGLITKKIVPDINPKWLTNQNWPINTPASSAGRFLSLQALITREIVFVGFLSDVRSLQMWPSISILEYAMRETHNTYIIFRIFLSIKKFTKIFVAALDLASKARARLI
jgi:hypothetical protein